MSTIGDIVTNTTYLDIETLVPGLSAFPASGMCRANGNYYIAAYRGSAADNPIVLVTFLVDPSTGAITLADTAATWLAGATYNIITLIPSFIAEGVVVFSGVFAGAVPIANTMYAVAVDSSGIINATPLSSAGLTTAGIDSGGGVQPGGIVHVAGDTYLLQLRTHAKVATVNHYYDKALTLSIPADGSSITVLDTVTLADSTTHYGTTNMIPCRVFQNIFAGGTADGFVTLSVNPATGVITTIDTSTLGIAVLGNTSVTKLENGWYIGTAGTSITMYSFHISDAGDIDAAYTAARAVVSNPEIYLEPIGASGTTAYVLIQWKDAGSDRQFSTYTIDAAGVISTAFETREVLTDWGQSPVVLPAGTGEVFVSFGYTSSAVRILTIQVGREALAITSITPNTGFSGTTLDVVIAGTGLGNFRRWSLGAGITINYYAVDSATQVTANITIAGAAAYGLRDLTGFIAGGSSLTLDDAFTVLTAPVIKTEVAWGEGIYETAPTWVDIAADLMTLKTKRGRKHELDRIEAGTATVVLNNSSGNYWRNNAAGTYYPNVKPLVPIRLSVAYGGVTYPIWRGMVESFNPDWLSDRGGLSPVMELQCVDLFKLLSLGTVWPLTDTVGAFTNVAEVTADIAAAATGCFINPAQFQYLHAGQFITLKDNNNSEVIQIQALFPPIGVVDFLGTCANAYNIADDACIMKFPAGLTGQRIGDVLYELGVPSAFQNIDAGVRTITEFVPDAKGSNAMEHLFDVARDEEGRLFMSAEGVVTFLDNVAAQSAPYVASAATFSDNGSNLDYVTPELSDDDEFIFNEAVVSGAGIDTQAIVDELAQVYQGRRVFDRANSLLSSNSQAIVQAYEIVNRWSDSKIRAKTLLIMPDGDPTNLYSKALGLDMLYRVTFDLDSTENPASISEVYHIEGVEHEWNARENVWVTLWQLWDINTYQDYVMTIGPEASGLYNFVILGTYATVHDDAVCDTVEDVAAIGQYQTAVPGDAFYVWRTVLEFDTTYLDVALTVTDASIIIRVGEFNHLGFGGPLAVDVEICVVACPVGVDLPLAAADYGALLTETTVLGSATLPAGEIPDQTVVIKLTAGGIAALNAGGMTRFGLRSRDDIDVTEPTSGDIAYLGILNTPTTRPALVVKIA